MSNPALHTCGCGTKMGIYSCLWTIVIDAAGVKHRFCSNQCLVDAVTSGKVRDARSRPAVFLD